MDHLAAGALQRLNLAGLLLLVGAHVGMACNVIIQVGGYVSSQKLVGWVSADSQAACFRGTVKGA
jgi:hypothetical protein